MDVLISVDEAARRLHSVAKPPQAEEVALLSADGRVLAGDAAATQDYPRFDRAMLDGFAVRSADIREATRETPAVLRVLCSIGAGTMPEGRVEAGTAIRTMTGAPVAGGADAIVRLEYAEEVAADGVRRVEVYRPVQPGEAIQSRGYATRDGDIIVPGGMRIGSAELSALATHGYEKVRVFRQPRVGILAVGSEIVEIGEPLPPGKLYNSNSLMIASLAKSSGAVPKLFSSCPDDSTQLAEHLNNALECCDVLVTTGGVSVGDFDLTARVLESLGAQRIFWGVWMRPGTPVYAGILGGKVVLALSGNPGAAFVNALVLLIPLIERMTGILHGHRRVIVQARISHVPALKRVKHTRFLRGSLTAREGELWIDVGGEHSPGFLSPLSGWTGLAQISPEMELTEGNLVSVLWMRL